MDTRIRRNEMCVIGLPRCDFVFSSTRMCFIAYGFQDSSLEMAILKHLLEARGVLAEEAAGRLAPAQNAFCAKICSKIITSQFCIVLANNETDGEREIPNANVNIEYGLMLGFNKYILPFQRESQKLPFNIAGLDTIKYTTQNFEVRAAQAIDQAVVATSSDHPAPVGVDQLLQTFLLSQHALIAPINTEGERTMFELGRPLGYNLLSDFSGMKIIYFGNFTALRPEIVVWRLQVLQDIINARIEGVRRKRELGMVTLQQEGMFGVLLKELEIWVLVTSEADKAAVASAAGAASIITKKIFSIEDVGQRLGSPKGS